MSYNPFSHLFHLNSHKARSVNKSYTNSNQYKSKSYLSKNYNAQSNANPASVTDIDSNVKHSKKANPHISTHSKDKPSQKLNQNLLIALVALFITMTANITFFNKATAIYPFATNAGFIVSISVLLFGLIWLLVQLISLISYQPAVKTILMFLLITASVCAYFTDTYGTVFDTSMLINGLETDQAEAMDLMAPIFVLRVVLLGIIPAFLVYKIKLSSTTPVHTAIQKGAGLLMSIALIAVALVPFGDQYASFFRQHKQVRYYANPVMPIYSSIKLGMNKVDEMRRPDKLIPHATDATRLTLTTASTTKSNEKPKLMVFVVGETARADHISLNGYSRNTMPLLSKESDVYSFQNVTSCGTSTAYSVPCMFSYAGQTKYDREMASYNENVLDTLRKQGINVIWRDNNSSSKGVADRVTYQDYKSNATNTVCDVECRDIGMLNGFDKILKSSTASKANSSNQLDKVRPQDTLIILHQMGNHGPAYYKRYPEEFETFTPVCKSNELSKCDQQSVINGYDNALIYTDYFLDNVINTLKAYENDYDVIMIYVSDHGESLGENNIYLHGLPYKLAPKTQKHVPAIIWSPSNNSVDTSSLIKQLNAPVSHDYITPTLLKFFNIQTSEVANKPTFFTLNQMKTNEKKRTNTN